MGARRKRLGVSAGRAGALVKAGPVFAVIATTFAVAGFGLDTRDVDIVGTVPQSLPPFTPPSFAPDLIHQLLMPARLISLIRFVESVSVDPDQELIGLGMANLGAAFSGGFPVTGGFSRSVVNFDAGVATPAA